MLVVSDEQFDSWTASVSDADKLVAYGYELENWQSTQSTIEKIESTIPEDEQYNFSSRVAPYNEAKQFSSLTMFSGIFVSLLFFIASGSMIYFKLFTELQDDQIQFKSLRRIGITDKEIRKIITSQIGMIFFIPFVVGTVHALFAFKMLQNLKVFGSVWQYGWTVIAIFFAMQLFYFLIMRRTYMRQIV